MSKYILLQFLIPIGFLTGDYSPEKRKNNRNINYILLKIQSKTV